MGTFPQTFRQVKEWLILELHETIRVPYIVTHPIVFVLFCDHDWQGGEFKVMKNGHLLVFLSVGSFSPSFLQVKG